jgi:hypothetical protein
MNNRSLRTPDFDPQPIRICSKEGLPARKFFQFEICGASPFILQFGPQAAMAIPQALEGRAAVLLSCAGNGNLGNARIHTQIHVAYRCEAENFLLENQVGFALPGLQQFGLTRARFKRGLQPAFCSQSRDNLVAGIPCQDTAVEWSRSIGRERPLHLLVGLIGIADFAAAAYGNLSGQANFLTISSTGQLVQSEGPERLYLPRTGIDPVSAHIGAVDGSLQRRKRFRPGRKFHFGGQPSTIEERTETQPAKTRPAGNWWHSPQVSI